MKNPLVSVVIPSYNRLEYLLKAIQSVLDQEYENIEIIVVNDGSTQEGYLEHKFIKHINIFDIYEQNFLLLNKKSYSLSFVFEIKSNEFYKDIINKFINNLINLFEKKLFAIIRK